MTSPLGPASGGATGDEVLDVVAAADWADVGGVADAGALYVWRGGSSLAGSVSPTATLTVPGASPSDRLAYDGFKCRSVFFADLDLDGVGDVVVSAPLADVGGTTNAGAVYVWLGGAGLSGATAPSASLTVPGAAANDRLGDAGGGGTRAVHAIDVTGDGLPDLVAAAEDADTAGVGDSGALYVWSGASGFSGAMAPTATLVVPGAQEGDHLTEIWSNSGVAQGLLFEDVTSDGITDLIACASMADVAGVQDAGAVYVWAGGTGLAGITAPAATLQVSGASQGDLLASLDGDGQGLLLADVTGDATSDIVIGAALASFGGEALAGAIYVWAGGTSLTGVPAVEATLGLESPQPYPDGWLGSTEGQGIVIGDVSGDGRKDILAVGFKNTHGGVQHSGGVYVWLGQADMPNPYHPSATLWDQNARPDDFLGFVGASGGAEPNPLLLGDLSGDGILDIIVGSDSADVPVGLPSAEYVGALYVWHGGDLLLGDMDDPAKAMVQAPTQADFLGRVGSGQGILLLDTAGMGRYDILGGASSADDGGTIDTGALLYWAVPDPGSGVQFEQGKMTVPGAAAQDRLGT